jgi:hypothetical protein
MRTSKTDLQMCSAQVHPDDSNASRPMVALTTIDASRNSPQIKYLRAPQSNLRLAFSSRRFLSGESVLK